MTAIPQFEASFDRLFSANTADAEARSTEFFTTFYRRFTRHPKVAELFAGTDMNKQISMLKRSIFDLVGFYVTGTPSAELYRLAGVHSGLGIDAELLDVWLEALLQTVVEYDRHADETTRLAWMAGLSPGLTFIRLQLLQPSDPD